MVTLVLGIGNTLLRDEGAGVHAIRALQTEYPYLGEVEYLDGGTLSFALAGAIEDSDSLIVIDAAELQRPAGTVQMFEDREMDRYLGSNRKRSVHEVGLLDLMAVAALAGHLPQRRALIGIQPLSVDWGEAPTAVVENAIPQACRVAVDLIRRWQQ
jgi:hydrogenase maturation protease